MIQVLLYLQKIKHVLAREISTKTHGLQAALKLLRAAGGTLIAMKLIQMASI